MIEWIYRDARAGTGRHDAMLNGVVRVGSVAWSAIRRDEPPYVAHSILPGIKEELGRFATQEEAKARVEAAFAHWLRKAGLAVATPVEQESDR